jgi:tRNA threonylcarbamoyladenosine biosynthesis protein TsaB
MKLLALETATEACSAALAINGDIIERYQVAPQQHTQLILPMVAELLAQAGIHQKDLDGVAFGCGPGSFTGVRIATSIAQGIALGLDIAVVPVSTLAALAQGWFNSNPTPNQVALVAMDARLGEIFWGAYQANSDGLATLMGKEAVTPANLVVVPNLPGYGVGSAWGIYADELQAQLGQQVLGYKAQHLPHASVVAQLGVAGFQQGLAVAAEYAMPVYLRDKVAKTEVERGVR